MILMPNHTRKTTDKYNLSYIKDNVSYMSTEVVAVVRKVGGSLMITIPKDVADSEGMKEGSTVSARLSRKRRSSFGAFPSLGPWEHPPELSHE